MCTANEVLNSYLAAAEPLLNLWLPANVRRILCLPDLKKQNKPNPA